MIKKLTLQNFGPFDVCNIDLAPLTLLAGYNYTGKSAAIEAIRGLSIWYLDDGKVINDMDCMKREGARYKASVRVGCVIKGESRSLSLDYKHGEPALSRFSTISDNNFPKVTRLVTTGYHSRIDADWLYNYIKEYKGVLLLEQPESFLHQSKQSLLGKALAAKVAEGGTQIIVETHSEHLFNGIRIAIKQGVLSPDDFIALNFSTNDEGIAQVESIPIDRAGGCDNWPDGFFGQSDVDYKELFGF